MNADIPEDSPPDRTICDTNDELADNVRGRSLPILPRTPHYELSQRLRDRHLDGLASPPCRKRVNTNALKHCSSEGHLETFAQMRQSQSRSYQMEKESHFLHRVRDLFAELTRPVSIQNTSLSLEEDVKHPENSVISFVDDSGQSGSYLVKDVVCIRMDIYSEPTRMDVLGQAMIVNRSDGLQDGEWLHWVLFFIMMMLLGRFFTVLIGPVTAVLVAGLLVLRRIVPNLFSQLPRDVDTFFEHYEPVVFCIATMYNFHWLLGALPVGWFLYVFLLVGTSFILFMQWQSITQLFSFRSRICSVRPSYPIVITLDATSFIATRAHFMRVCRDRIARVEVFPYWAEVSLSIILPSRLYNSKAVRQYISYFMAFAMPIINLFYVSSLTLPLVTAMMHNILDQVRQDLVLWLLKNLGYYIFKFIPSLSIPMVVQDIFQALYKLFLSSISALSWFSSYLSPFDAVLTQIRIRFSFLWTLTLTEPIRAGINRLWLFIRLVLQAFVPLIRLLNTIYALVKRPLDAVRSFMHTLTTKPVAEIKAMLYRFWLLITWRHNKEPTEYVVGLRTPVSSAEPSSDKNYVSISQENIPASSQILLQPSVYSVGKSPHNNRHRKEPSHIVNSKSTEESFCIQDETAGTPTPRMTETSELKNYFNEKEASMESDCDSNIYPETATHNITTQKIRRRQVLKS